MPLCPGGACQDRRHWDTRGMKCVQMPCRGDYREFWCSCSSWSWIAWRESRCEGRGGIS